MLNSARLFFLLLLSTLMLSGCSTTSSLMDSLWWSDDEEVTDFTEPSPTQEIGLSKQWSRSVSGEPDEYMSHPRRFVVDGDSVFVGTYDGDVVRVNAEEGDIVWRRELEVPIAGGVAVDEQRVFAGTVDGEMVAISRQTGEVVWKSTVSTKVASAPLVMNGMVIFTTLNNRTYALDVNSGERIWSHASVPVVLVVQGAATPTGRGNIAYIGYSTGEVFALNIRNGKVLWMENLSRLSGRTELDRLQDVDAEIVLGQEGMRNQVPKIYAVNHQGSIMAMQAANGAQVWSNRFSAIRRPLLWRDRLFLANVEGQVVSMGSDDGLEVWRVKVSDGMLTAPVSVNDKIVVADNKGRLMTLDPTSGRVLGLEKLGDPITANPLVQGSNLFIWTREGNLINYRIDH